MQHSIGSWDCKGRYVFYWGGGGGPGLRRGGSLVNFSQIGGAQTCFIRNWGRVTVFLGKEKNLSMSLSWLLFVNKHAKCIETLNLYIQVKLPVKKCIETLNLYIQVKLPVKINLNYLQVSKYYIKKLSSPNYHNRLSRPVPSFVHILTVVMFPRGVLV